MGHLIIGVFPLSLNWFHVPISSVSVYKSSISLDSWTNAKVGKKDGQDSFGSPPDGKPISAQRRRVDDPSSPCWFLCPTLLRYSHHLTWWILRAIPVSHPHLGGLHLSSNGSRYVQIGLIDWRTEPWKPTGSSNELTNFWPIYHFSSPKRAT